MTGTTPAGVSRRDFLAFAAIPGWLPWFRPRHVSLAGARFRIVHNGNRRRRYLLIHGNEETARQVLTRHIHSHEGVAYFIETNTRNISIEGGEIDPNRMFSRVGAEASLKKLNPGWPPDRVQRALDLLDHGRERLVSQFLPKKRGLTVALHNNSESYSVTDEVDISDAKSLREPSNPHAFFLCTDPADFKILATSAYNVVLQQHGPKDDDGSLSRLAATRGERYVNLEVGHGHAGRQQEMLSWLEWVLPE